MGKRRRKLLRRKYAKLSWNKYYENLKNKNEQPQEQIMTKVIEDNSVVLERMKNVSSACDNILQTIDNIQEADETTIAAIVEPQFLATEPPPELEEEEVEIQDLKKMLKKDLLNLASEMGLNLKSSTTKANIIKAIQAT